MSSSPSFQIQNKYNTRIYYHVWFIIYLILLSFRAIHCSYSYSYFIILKIICSWDYLILLNSFYSHAFYEKRFFFEAGFVIGTYKLNTEVFWYSWLEVINYLSQSTSWFTHSVWLKHTHLRVLRFYFAICWQFVFVKISDVFYIWLQ